MKELLLIFIGGGLGSTVRYLISRIVDNNNFILGFPLGTLSVNIIGSFLLGMGVAAVGNNPAHWLRHLFIIGFCGGFTTFSTFSNDALQLMKTGNHLHFFLYILVSLISCLSAVYLGFKLVN